jgi:arsenite methyltransferase
MGALRRLRVSLSSVLQKTTSRTQEQTRDAFGFKWAKRETYDSAAVQSANRQWLLDRYFEGDIQKLHELLDGAERKIILDAGCGSGFSALLLFGELLRKHDYLGVDISSAVEVARVRFSEREIPGDFLNSRMIMCENSSRTCPTSGLGRHSSR